MSHDDKTEIAKARFITGETIAAIAEQLGISRRTIERWAAKPDEQGRTWYDLRETAKATPTSPKPQPPKPAPKPQTPEPHPLILATADAPLAIAQEVIQQLQTELRMGGPGKAPVANALRQWMEYRDQLNPPTIDQLADLVVTRLTEWSLSPADLVAVLKQRFGESKRAQ